MVTRPELPMLPAPKASDDLHEVVIGRVARRLIPFAFICYVVAYIDRVNIGFAASALQKDLGLSATAYGIGAGLFFLGYCVFEVPSNLILAKVGARRWIARILIAWGLVSMGMMFVTDVTSFYIARVLLGIAEAGFFPGMVLYLTFWIPAADRARTGALFMMAAPIAVIVGAPVSEALLSMHGWGGLRGWQWLFVGEGLPAVVLGVLALRVLTDTPEEATWLAKDEREWLIATLKREQVERQSHHRASLLQTLLAPRLWLLIAVYFLNTVVTYGIFLWLPKILRDASGASGFRLTAMTMVPFIAALIGMVLIGRHSDRTAERKWHVAACALTAAVGLVLAVVSGDNIVLLVLSFTLSQIGQRSVVSVFWAIPPIFLGGMAAAAGIGLINAIGNLGGALGPSIIGWLRDVTGAYDVSLLVLAGVLLLEAILAASLRLPASSPVVSSRVPATRVVEKPIA
jgi:ACS family tartrate transporter-like MFS transporter